MSRIPAWPPPHGARPEFYLLRGRWSSLVRLGPTDPEGAVKPGGLRGLLHQERPAYGPGTKEVLGFLELIPRLDVSNWEHLYEDANQILVGIDWADGAYVHALQAVAALAYAMSSGQRLMVEADMARVDGELRSLSLTELKGPLVRAYAAAGRRCIELFVGKPAEQLDERKFAAGCRPLFLSATTIGPAEDWERLWGGPLL